MGLTPTSRRPKYLREFHIITNANPARSTMPSGLNYKYYKTVKVARFGTLTSGRARMHEVGRMTGQQGMRDGPTPHKQAPHIITKVTFNYKRKSGPVDHAKRFELQKFQNCQSRQIWDFDIWTRQDARSRPHDRPARQVGWAQSPQAGAPINYINYI